MEKHYNLFCEGKKFYKIGIRCFQVTSERNIKNRGTFSSQILVKELKIAQQQFFEMAFKLFKIALIRKKYNTFYEKGMTKAKVPFIALSITIKYYTQC
jgi:hypothetical protein